VTISTRPIKLTYAGVEFGRGTNFIIDASQRPIYYDKNADAGKFTFSCEIVVSRLTETDFLADCQTVETTFSETKNNQAFKLSFYDDAAVPQEFKHEEYDPTANPITGFNARPSYRKPGSDTDTALSRRYEVSVVIDLPATETGKSGKRRSTWTLGFSSANRRTLTVEGTFTALGSNTAYEQYRSAITAYATTLQVALGGTWIGPFNERVFGDDEYGASATYKIGKIVRFSRTYEQLVGAVTGDARIRIETLEVTKILEQPGDFAFDGSPVYRLQRYTASFDASVDIDQSTDLKTVYETVVRPFVLNQVRIYSGKVPASVLESVKFDVRENRVHADMAILTTGGSSIVAATVVTLDEEDAGVLLVGVYDGRKKSKYRFDYAGSFRRTVVQDYDILGASSSGQGDGPNVVLTFNRPLSMDASRDGDGANKMLIGDEADDAFAESGGVPEPNGLTRHYLGGSIRTAPRVIGVPGNSLRVTHVTRTRVWEYVLEPKSKGGGTTGGGGGAPPVATGAATLGPTS
jgi:hypothetical protein